MLRRWFRGSNTTKPMLDLRRILPPNAGGASVFGSLINHDSPSGRTLVPAASQRCEHWGPSSQPTGVCSAGEESQGSVRYISSVDKKAVGKKAKKECCAK